MSRVMTKMANSILDFIFPTTCLFCKKGSEIICLECFHNIPQKHIESENVFSYYQYKNERVNKLLWKLKYHHSIFIAKMFGKVLAEGLDGMNEKIILIPIPLGQHDKRIHNHANLIAENIKGNLINKEIEIIPDLLIKKTNFKQAHTSSRQSRLDNVKGIFSINPKHKSLKLDGKIILVDDVTTTGATINEVRIVLGEFLKINPKEILAITVAH